MSDSPETTENIPIKISTDHKPIGVDTLEGFYIHSSDSLVAEKLFHVFS